jgi:hypothetical protein
MRLTTKSTIALSHRVLLSWYAHRPRGLSEVDSWVVVKAVVVAEWVDWRCVRREWEFERREVDEEVWRERRVDCWVWRVVVGVA